MRKHAEPCRTSRKLVRAISLHERNHQRAESIMKRLRTREFLLMAGAGAVAAFLWFDIMYIAFGTATQAANVTLFPYQALIGEIVGFVAFLLWLACAVVAVVGLVGALWRALSH